MDISLYIILRSVRTKLDKYSSGLIVNANKITNVTYPANILDLAFTTANKQKIQ